MQDRPDSASEPKPTGNAALPVARVSASPRIPLAAATPQQPIIDYAGRRPRQATRLPASSEVHITAVDGEVHVLETLTGKPHAIGAIIFALFTMAAMIATLFGDWGDAISRTPTWDQIWMAAFFPGLPLVTEAIVMCLVIDSTWGRTELRVGRSGVHLGMSSPFRRRSYDWSRDDLQQISVRQTGMSPGGLTLGELQMLVAGREVRLFTDHEYRGLADLAARLAEPRGSQGE